MRLDGFTSIQGRYQGGTFTTKPFTFSGKKLELNYATSAVGEIKVEIQDENGKPIPGFSLDESQTIIGNEISRIVEWNSKSDVSGIAGKTVRMKIYIKDADLYSLKFTRD